MRKQPFVKQAKPVKKNVIDKSSVEKPCNRAVKENENLYELINQSMNHGEVHEKQKTAEEVMDNE